MSTTYRIFVGVTSRLEVLLEAELQGLGLDLAGTRVHGGVEIAGGESAIWTIAHQSRLAESVRVDLGQVPAHDFADLERGMQRLPWHAYAPLKVDVQVHATARRSALYHTGAIAEHTKRAIVDRLAGRPGSGTGKEATLNILVRVVRDSARIAVDAIGGPLYQRGYRTHVGVAPIRETLAAACVRLAGIPRDAVVWDPFCGSGTMLLEQAGVSGGFPAAPASRSFAFTSWPTHDAEGYASFLESLPDPSLSEGIRFIGSDHNPSEIAAARANAEGAGLSDVTTWLEGDVGDIVDQIPEGAAVLTNLPYGARTEKASELANSFNRFGGVLRKRPDLGPVVVLNGNSRFGKQSGFDGESLLQFANRGLDVELLRLR